MEYLENFKETIHKCSKCGLCQADCPIYKITGNDCTVSRGQFIMLNGVINGDLKFTENLNHYLDICLKCNKCSTFCPSGINVVDVIAAAKHEYLKKSYKEKFKSFLQKKLVFEFFPNTINKIRPISKSKTFDKKVLLFSGCRGKYSGTSDVIKILNKAHIEVIDPNFNCCGISYFVRGDFKSYHNQIKNFINILKKYEIREIVTTCSSCEKTLKSYIRWTENDEDKNILKNISIKNIYSYLAENQIKLSLKKHKKVTYHKPCSLENYSDIEWILKNTENLDYIEMKNFDSCCGLNGLFKFKEYKILRNIFKNKVHNIQSSKSKIVLTSCFGCETALKSYSLFRYKTYDLIKFLGKFMEK